MEDEVKRDESQLCEVLETMTGSLSAARAALKSIKQK